MSAQVSGLSNGIEYFCMPKHTLGCAPMNQPDGIDRCQLAISAKAEMKEAVRS
ncbi:hypothetical protein EV132_1229 [Rhizobium sullae]|uniref:Uncharacterized protein n=1 Tax=Rhizobium sullae TaxID=50338 RepID=A0A4R3Q1F0_RHISU|nr:hypothetical protein EV132_1229 [Rhizobium sullae]